MHAVDSWKAHTGKWMVSVDVANRPLTLEEARALLADLKREIDRAERDDDDGGA